MKYFVLAMGLCFVSASLSTPLEAATKSRPANSHAVKPKKIKIKAHKAPKPAKIRTRAN